MANQFIRCFKGLLLFVENYLDCKGDREGEYHSEWKAESGEGVGSGTKGGGALPPGTLCRREGEGDGIGALRSGAGGAAPPALLGLRKPVNVAWNEELWEL